MTKTTRFKYSYWQFWLIVSAIFVAPYSTTIAQESDSSLQFEQFGKDDLIHFSPQKEQKVYAAGRLLEDKKEVPKRIFIITRDEIVLEGYSTIVDILKNIPGFRTSQPGSSKLGETFLARGLVGNTHATILINGQPVKPIGAPGMPIGSNLPIKQAERIEIILGPSSTLYGSDAMAGVINIVLPEINRPVEVSSDIRVGTGGLTEINTSLGGKVGKNKNVMVYNLYGSNKSVNDYPLEVSQFVVSDDIANNPNFIAEPEDPNTPEIRNIPHVSSLIGANIKFRDFTFNGNIMSRQDHSALGAFPAQVSYSDQGSYFGEKIYQTGLQYNRKLKENWSILVNGSFLYYEVDNNSSYTGIDHYLSNGRNHMYAESGDLRIEPIVSYNKGPFNLLVGAQLLEASGTNLQNYLQHPFDSDKLPKDSAGNILAINSVDPTGMVEDTSLVDEFEMSSYSVFSQLFYKREKLNIIAGFRYEMPENISGVLNPNLGLVYKVNKQFNLKGSYAHAFQVPGPYYQSNNYEAGYTITPPFAPQQTDFSRTRVPLTPERLRNLEFSANYHLARQSVSVVYYRHTLLNSIFTDINVQYDTLIPPPPTGYFIGYLNRSTYSKLQGIQLSYSARSGPIKYDIHALYHTGEEEIEVRDGTEITGYRSMPAIQVLANIRGVIKQKNIVGAHFRFDGPFINQVYLDRGNLVAIQTGSSYNVDFYINRQFGKNISATLKVVNLTNSVTKGIFTNWLDGYEFDYVPQLNRWFFISLSYRLN